MKLITIAIFVNFLTFIFPNQLVSQDKQNDVKKKQRRWMISYDLATTSRGPADDIENALVAIGFDDTSPGFGGTSGSKRPVSYTGCGWTGFSWMISAHYLLKSPITVGAMISHSKIGETSGYRSESFLDLTIKYAVTTLAPIISIQTKGLKLGVGPALHFCKSSQQRGENMTSTKIGLVFDFGFAFPSKSLFFIEAKLQYHVIGKAEIGPFKVQNTLGSAVLPATQVNYNHHFVGLGIGIRFLRR